MVVANKLNGLFSYDEIGVLRKAFQNLCIMGINTVVLRTVSQKVD